MFLIGAQLGRYMLTDWLGSGGMGDVYLAEENASHERVAVKVMKAELALGPDQQDAEDLLHDFQKEARAITSLDHPGILKLLAYGEARVQRNTLAYLVMPYCAGGNLLQWLQEDRRERTLSLKARGKLIEQAASALQYAHDHQVIHRDVKPSNFLIEEQPGKPDEPVLLLSDFGIAKLMNATSSVSQHIRGTPAYMAPEQWGGAATIASDQYALAVMAYELLAGSLPFTGSPLEMLHLHLHARPAAASSFNPDLPRGVDAVLRCALHKKPQQRYPSISAFAHNLLNALAGQKYTVSAPEEKMQQQAGAGIARAPTQPARRRGLVLGAGLLACFLLGSFLLVLARGDGRVAGGVTSNVTQPAASPATAFPTASLPDQSNSDGSSEATPAPTTPPLLPTADPMPLPTADPTPLPTADPTPLPAAAPVILGGVNLDGYCQSLGDSSASLDGTTGYDWRCVTLLGDHNGVSMTAACQWQYADPHAEDRLLDYYEPGSWQCFTSASLLGNATNLDGYCQSLGDSGVSLDGNTAYDWKCVTAAGQHVGLDMTAVCIWQYGRTNLLTRMADFNNPNSWQCWG